MEERKIFFFFHLFTGVEQKARKDGITNVERVLFEMIKQE